MKNRLLILTLINVFFLAACINPAKDDDISYLSASIGDHDEVLVLMDQGDWDSSLGDSVYKYLTAAFMVLPQYEPVFKVNQVDYEHFSQLYRKFRNILIIAPLNGRSKTAGYLRQLLGKEKVGKAATLPTANTAIIPQLFAQNQLIIGLFAPDMEILKKDIHNKINEAIKTIQRAELNKYHSSAFYTGINREVTEKLQKTYQINLTVPDDFVLAIEESNFLWLRKETPESSSNIMIAFKQFDSDVPNYLPAINKDDFANSAIEWRNAIGRKFIHTRIDSAYMTTGDVLPVIQKKINLNGFPAYENKGLWKMVNDFMGGPFINYYILDEANNRVIFIEGFVHAPKIKKKKLIRQLEAVLTGFGSAR